MEEERLPYVFTPRRGRKTFIVKIQHIEDGRICGSVYDIEERQCYYGLFDLVKKIDKACEDGNGPQRTYEYRRFGRALNTRKIEQEFSNIEWIDGHKTKLDAGSEKVLVLRIEILYRENASMQGRISISDITPINFRSALELMLLIDEIVEKSYKKTIEGGLNLRKQYVDAVLSV